jgi:hypothetical protein
MRSRSAVMYTSFKVSITVLTHRRYNTCRASGLVQIAYTQLTALNPRVGPSFLLCRIPAMIQSCEGEPMESVWSSPAVEQGTRTT